MLENCQEISDGQLLFFFQPLYFTVFSSFLLKSNPLDQETQLFRSCQVGQVQCRHDQQAAPVEVHTVEILHHPQQCPDVGRNDKFVQ